MVNLFLKAICEPQLNFTGQCTRMPKDELASRFFHYESKIMLDFIFDHELQGRNFVPYPIRLENARYQ